MLSSYTRSILSSKSFFCFITSSFSSSVLLQYQTFLVLLIYLASQNFFVFMFIFKNKNATFFFFITQSISENRQFLQLNISKVVFLLKSPRTLLYNFLLHTNQHPNVNFRVSGKKLLKKRDENFITFNSSFSCNLQEV